MCVVCTPRENVDEVWLDIEPLKVMRACVAKKCPPPVCESYVNLNSSLRQRDISVNRVRHQEETNKCGKSQIIDKFSFTSAIVDVGLTRVKFKI